MSTSIVDVRLQPCCTYLDQLQYCASLGDLATVTYVGVNVCEVVHCSEPMRSGHSYKVCSYLFLIWTGVSDLEAGSGLKPLS